jgi:hypothetical protein
MILIFDDDELMPTPVDAEFAAPVSEDLTLHIIRGDDYIANRQLAWKSTEWPILLNSTIMFYCSTPDGLDSFSKVGGVIVLSDRQELVVALTASDTLTFLAGYYDYQLKASWPGGQTVTLVSGRMAVLERVYA